MGQVGMGQDCAGIGQQLLAEESHTLVTFNVLSLNRESLIGQTLRAGTLDIRFLLLSAGALLIAALTGPKFAIGIFAGIWAWRAGMGKPHRLTAFFHVLLVIGLLEALLGITQRFLLPGWIFAYQNFGTVSGTLINHNHFAGLMGMLAFVPFGLAYARVRGGQLAGPYVYVLASAFIAFALICSLSRMGIVSFVAGAALSVIVIRMAGRTARNIGLALGLGLLGLLLLGAVWIGVDAFIDSYAALVGNDQGIEDSRPIIFRDTMRMIADHPWGIGPGNYQDVFRRYQTTRLRLLFDHTHNDYLEMAAEWGVLAAAVFWALIVLVLIRSVKVFLSSNSFQSRGNILTCIGAIATIMVHSLADFNLQIPVNASLFFIFVGLALTCGNAPKLRAASPADFHP